MKKQSSWTLLIIAGILEIGWATGLKFSEGFTVLMPSLVVLLLLPASFYCFAKAIKTMALGVAYAIFTGMGALGTVVIGMLFMDEPASMLKIISVIVLVAGIVGLKQSDGEGKGKTQTGEGT